MQVERARDEAVVKMMQVERARDEAVVKMMQVERARDEAVVKMMQVERARDEAVVKMMQVERARDEAVVKLMQVERARDEGGLGWGLSNQSEGQRTETEWDYWSGSMEDNGEALGESASLAGGEKPNNEPKSDAIDMAILPWFQHTEEDDEELPAENAAEGPPRRAPSTGSLDTELATPGQSVDAGCASEPVAADGDLGRQRAEASSRWAKMMWRVATRLAVAQKRQWKQLAGTGTIPEADGYDFMSHSEADGYDFMSHSEADGYDFMSHSEADGYDFMSHSEADGYDFTSHSEADGYDFTSHSEADGYDFMSHSEADGHDFMRHSEADGYDFMCHSEADGYDFMKQVWSEAVRMAVWLEEAKEMCTVSRNSEVEHQLEIEALKATLTEVNEANAKLQAELHEMKAVVAQQNALLYPNNEIDSGAETPQLPFDPVLGPGDFHLQQAML
eukprot:gene19641-23492_t